MISINDLIFIQNPKERTAFINFLEKRNKRHDTRNISLYKDYLKGDEKYLLNEISSNAYNALKKRLTDQLIAFLASNFLSSELSAENQVIKLIAISRKLFSSNRIHTGFILLKRAEKIALTLDHHSLLNEIYHSMIEHSHKSPKSDHVSLFKKLEKNNEQFIAQERLSVLYASMHHQFNAGDFNILPSSLHKMYDAGLKTFGINPELALNFRSLNQLCILTDLYASQTKNYKELDLFFEDYIQELQGSDKDTEKTLGYHIELLYGMSNIYFRKKNLIKSMFYLDQMNAQCNRYNAKIKKEWQAKHVNLLALNYNFSGEFNKALELINDYITSPLIKETEKSLLNLTLFMIHFQQGNLDEAKKTKNAFKKTDAWYLKQMGNEWLFNFKAMEVLLHFDLGDDQLAESRIHSFNRKYAIRLKHDKDNPIWPFLLLVKSILINPDLLFTEKFKEKVETSIPWKGENEDFFNMCFYAWLKAKMIRQSVYETTLGLLNLEDTKT